MIKPFDFDEEPEELEELDEPKRCNNKVIVDKKEEQDNLMQDEELCNECEDETNQIVKWKITGVIVFVVVILIFIAI